MSCKCPQNKNVAGSCHETQNSWGCVPSPFLFLSKSLRKNIILSFGILGIFPSEVGGRIFFGQGHNFESPLVSCSDRSPACCHSGHPSLHSGFCQRQVYDSVFLAFYCSQPWCLFSIITQWWSNPLILKIEEEKEIYKNISIFFLPLTAQEKWAHALKLIVSMPKSELRIVPPRVWNNFSRNYSKVVLTLFEKCLINRIIFVY
jgi:hypothetical protein